MGGFLQILDFNPSGMARKILSNKTHDGGLDAPRNSLELQVDPSQSYYAMADAKYSNQVEEDWSEKNSYPIEASMKKLIHEEISKPQNARQAGAPSIVARLMGVDELPVDTKPVDPKTVVVQSVKNKKENAGKKSSKKENNGSVERSGRGAVAHISFESNPSSWDNHQNNGGEDEQWNSSQRYGKPRRREHPQEEELQKFKKEFEAWQAARFRECSSLVKPDVMPHHQNFAQENLNREKMTLKVNSGRMVEERHVEPNAIMLNSGSLERGRSVQHHRHKSEIFPAENKYSSFWRSRSRTLSREFEQSVIVNYDQHLDKYSAPTRIVILKPGPYKITDHEDSWTSSSSTFDERSRIEDFLEEVKERLKCELQGKAIKKGTIVRGSGIETPYSENPSDPKQIAHNIGKQVRDSVTRDLLRRSESTRSCRSEIHFNGLDSPEFINKDTKRLLSERLRNVLKRETKLEASLLVSGKSSSSMLDRNNSRLKHEADPLLAENDHSYWENTKDDEQDMLTRSFRHGDDEIILDKELSPRNLIRSMSAPVSGTSFGKLLLEDRHILTGAQIRRKHEAIENGSADLRRNKKDKLNFKEKVSNFRYNFTLRGMLFGKKLQSFMESQNVDLHPVKDIMSGPTVIMNYGERLLRENSTEVPPSPASVCSSANEEFWRPVDNVSPVSTPDANREDDSNTPQFFKEISSNLIELRRKLSELEANGLAETTSKQEPVEPEIVDIENYAEAYIRDLLVASGLYHGSTDKTLSRWNPLAKPISKSVFEEVEESYRKLDKEYQSDTKDHNEKKIDHKILFDLLNEALSIVLGPPVTLSRFRRKILDASMLTPLKGRKLLDSVWETLRDYLYPSTEISDHLLEKMVAHDLESAPWNGLMDEEIIALGKEVEGLVFGELVEDVVKDIQHPSSVHDAPQ